MSSEYETKTVNGRERPVHILLMEEILGQPLKENEVVHHINGDKRDNRPENLQILDRGEHTALHKRGATVSGESLEKMRAAQKGRRSTQRKLTNEQVRDIAVRLTEGSTLIELATEYGISRKSIAAICDGKTYRDVLCDYPDSAFPLKKKKAHAPKSIEERRFSIDQINDIRIRLLQEESVNSIAKIYHTAPATIRQIRDRETYQDIPWPEEIGRYYQPGNPLVVLLILLSLPMSDKEDEYLALKEDYQLMPDWYSVLMLRTVRRALAGDTELATVLMYLAGYGNELNSLIAENSVVLNTLVKKHLPESSTSSN
jgi:hypothetical protein